MSEFKGIVKMRCFVKPLVDFKNELLFQYNA